MDNFKKKIKRILRRMLGRPEPPMRKAPNRLPDDIDAAVRKNGLETDGFIKVVESDMDFDGCYLTAWTALDDKGIILSSAMRKSPKSAETKKSSPSMNSERYALIRSRISIRSNASSMSQQDAL